jgi:hypothetical protein
MTTHAFSPTCHSLDQRAAATYQTVGVHVEQLLG